MSAKTKKQPMHDIIEMYNINITLERASTIYGEAATLKLGIEMYNINRREMRGHVTSYSNKRWLTS